MKDRTMICVACHERKRTAELCLPTLKWAIYTDDLLVCYNDGSTEYGTHWLRQLADKAIGNDPAKGIEWQRREHLRDFWASDYDRLYFTDHDCIHDPGFMHEARRLQDEYGALVCLYNTEAHSRLPGNTIEDDPTKDIIWRRYAPGVSYLLTRAMVAKIMPHLHTLTAFDWQIPSILGNRCAISRTSYVDHVGWKGLRHPMSEGIEGGDRATNPTLHLQFKRAEIVAKLIEHERPAHIVGRDQA